MDWAKAAARRNEKHLRFGFDSFIVEVYGDFAVNEVDYAPAIPALRVGMILYSVWESIK